MDDSPTGFLRYRRQFVLGPRPARHFLDGPCVSVGPDLVLRCQRDLPLQQIDHAGLRLTLLGYLLDPAGPELDDRAILMLLAERCERALDIPQAMADLAGRWVLIADDRRDCILLNDACSLREVFFAGHGSSGIWCASQPARIADELELEPGAAAREFMASTYFQRHHEPWWPGGTTPWDGIFRLQPNHYLDLRRREAVRFWPDRQLPELGPGPAAQRAAQLLRAIVHAGARRFPLALPLTAGRDSRAILAASRGLGNIWHYTCLRPGLTQACADIRTPRRLLRQIGRAHHVVQCPQSMSGEFARRYRENTTPAHDAAGAIAEGLLARYPQLRVSMSGHCSEIARDTFGISHTPPPDGAALAALMGMRDNPYAIEHFGRWLADARPVADRLHHRVWDLFFWEQEYGTWAANGQSQWDLVHERFTPFAHRGLLETLLAVDPAHRQGPRYPLFERMMEILWPAVLAEPFNEAPRSFDARLRSFVRRVLERGSAGRVARRLGIGVARPAYGAGGIGGDHRRG